MRHRTGGFVAQLVSEGAHFSFPWSEHSTFPKGTGNKPPSEQCWNTPCNVGDFHARGCCHLHLMSDIQKQSQSPVNSFTHFSWIKTIYLLCSIFHLHIFPLNCKKHTFTALLGNLQSHGLLQLTLFNILCFAGSQVWDRCSPLQHGTRQH